MQETVPPDRDRSRPRALPMVALLVASAALVGLGGFVLARGWKPRTYRVNMLTDLIPNRALLARRIASEAKRHRLDVELTGRPVGALEALELVDTPNPINLALVPGGVARRDYPNVRQVSALALEPLHLLVRAELAGNGLAGLKGRRINIGPTTDAAEALARDVLAFAGLRAPATGSGGAGDYVPEGLAPAEIGRRLAALQALRGPDRDRALGELPDAVMFLSPLPSLLARELVAAAGYRLVPLPFADAYGLDRITPTDSGDAKVDRAILSATEIPAYTYGIDPAVPPAPCRTVATRLLLVAYAPTEPEAVARLLETIFEGPIAGLVEPVPLRDQVPQFAFHPGTELYMRRNEPFLTPEMLSGVGKVSGGLGAFASGIVAFYGFLRLRQLRRFESYYHEIRRIERVARGLDPDPAAPVAPSARRDYLEGQLLDLKGRAMSDFAEGGLKGEGLMTGIVALIGDTRRSIEHLSPPATADRRSPTTPPAGPGRADPRPTVGG